MNFALNCTPNGIAGGGGGEIGSVAYGVLLIGRVIDFERWFRFAAAAAASVFAGGGDQAVEGKKPRLVQARKVGADKVETINCWQTHYYVFTERKLFSSTYDFRCTTGFHCTSEGVSCTRTDFRIGVADEEESIICCADFWLTAFFCLLTFTQ